MNTTECHDCIFAAADPDGLFCTHKTSMNPTNIWGWGLRRARQEGQPCGPQAIHFERASSEMLRARGRALPDAESIVGLREGDALGVAPNVDESVPVSASGTQEVAPVVVDLGQHSSEHNFESTSSARPHAGAPVVDADGTAAAGSKS